MAFPTTPRRSAPRVPLLSFFLLGACATHPAPVASAAGEHRAPPSTAMSAPAPSVSPEERAAITAFAERVTAARRDLARDGGHLWGAPMDGVAWMGVTDKELFLTASPASDVDPRVVDGVWIVERPEGLAVANTRTTWSGRTWAMVVLPLPEDMQEATRLLIHEGFHVDQPSILSLPKAEQSDGAELLQSPEGRTFFGLECAALAAALESTGEAQRTAIDDALLFRARRYEAGVVGERKRETVLDLSEGLAEYTAWALSGSDGRRFAAELRRERPESQSLVRSFPYLTGPAYGFLLDVTAGERWRRDLQELRDVQRLLARAVGSPLDVVLEKQLAGTRVSGDEMRAAAEKRGAAYGLAELRRRENARWEAQRKVLVDLESRFVGGPTLHLHPRALRFTFDPSGQMTLPGKGTVMRNFNWTDPSGAELDAPDGGLVVPDWSEVRVPLGEVAFTSGPLETSHTWKGPGWTLTLPATWTLTREGTSWIAWPPPGGAPASGN